MLAATVAAGGSGYKVNDVLTVQGGTFLTPATLKVLELTGLHRVFDISEGRPED